jgi:hypothetical protein
MEKIDFNKWLDKNEERLSIIAAEGGYDREYDFEPEDFAEAMYDDEIGFD